MKTATVSAETTALAHTGRGFKLQPGVYAVVDIDGADGQGVAYLKGPDGGKLVCVSLTDRLIDIKETAPARADGRNNHRTGRISGMKSSFAAAVLLVAVLSGCGSDPAPAPAASSTPVVAPTSAPTSAGNSAAPMAANLCSPGKDLGCGTPDAECSTNRLGKQFVLDGVVYTCGGEKPYKWRR